jgi:hypothetical protein
MPLAAVPQNMKKIALLLSQTEHGLPSSPLQSFYPPTKTSCTVINKSPPS